MGEDYGSFYNPYVPDAEYYGPPIDVRRLVQVEDCMRSIRDTLNEFFPSTDSVNNNNNNTFSNNNHKSNNKNDWKSNPAKSLKADLHVHLTATGSFNFWAKYKDKFEPIFKEKVEDLKKEYLAKESKSSAALEQVENLRNTLPKDKVPKEQLKNAEALKKETEKAKKQFEEEEGKLQALQHPEITTSVPCGDWIEHFKKLHRVYDDILDYAGNECIAELLESNARLYLEAGIKYVEFSLSFNSFKKYAPIIIQVTKQLEQKPQESRVVFRYLAAFNRKYASLSEKQLKDIYDLPLTELYNFIFYNNSETIKTTARKVMHKYENAASELKSICNDHPDLWKYIVGFDYHGLEDYNHQPFIPFLPAFTEMWDLACKFKRSNQNFGFRIHAGEFNPDKLAEVTQTDKVYFGMLCAWNTISKIIGTSKQQGETFTVRIGHGLAFPEFFNTLMRVSLASLKAVGVSDCHMLDKLPLQNILDHKNVFIEHCPISNCYLISPPTGALSLGRIYHQLHKNTKVVLGTDDPLFFGQMKQLCGISLKTPDSGSPFHQVLQSIQQAPFRYTEEDIEQIWRNSWQAKFCDPDTLKLLYEYSP